MLEVNFHDFFIIKKFQEAQKTVLPYLGGQKGGTPHISPQGGAGAKNFLAMNWHWGGGSNEPLVVWIGQNGYATSIHPSRALTVKLLVYV